MLSILSFLLCFNALSDHPLKLWSFIFLQIICLVFWIRISFIIEFLLFLIFPFLWTFYFLENFDQLQFLNNEMRIFFVPWWAWGRINNIFYSFFFVRCGRFDCRLMHLLHSFVLSMFGFYKFFILLHTLKIKPNRFEDTNSNTWPFIDWEGHIFQRFIIIEKSNRSFNRVHIWDPELIQHNSPGCGIFRRR